MRKLPICLFFTLLITAVLAIPVSAAEYRSVDASDYFMSTELYLRKNSSTQFDICFEATGVGTMDEIGASLIKVQRSSNGSSWSDVKTYTKESYPQLIDKNTTIHNHEEPYSGTQGYYYRAYIEFYAQKGYNVGTLYRYTASIKL